MINGKHFRFVELRLKAKLWLEKKTAALWTLVKLVAEIMLLFLQGGFPRGGVRCECTYPCV